ncbi:unnamed protein product [Lampetra fluviatilis]
MLAMSRGVAVTSEAGRSRSKLPPSESSALWSRRCRANAVGRTVMRGFGACRWPGTVLVPVVPTKGECGPCPSGEAPGSSCKDESSGAGRSLFPCASIRVAGTRSQIAVPRRGGGGVRRGLGVCGFCTADGAFQAVARRRSVASGEEVVREASARFRRDERRARFAISSVHCSVSRNPHHRAVEAQGMDTCLIQSTSDTENVRREIKPRASMPSVWTWAVQRQPGRAHGLEETQAVGSEEKG